MKIILVHNNYNVSGGAEVFFHEVGRVLRERGHDVAYFSTASDSADTIWRTYLPKVQSYKSAGMVRKVLGFPSMVYSRLSKKEFKRLINDFKPDVIHVFAIYIQLTPSILDAAREAGVPVVMSCNDYKHICPNYKLYHHGHICEDCKGGRFYNTLLNRCCHDSLAVSAASMVEGYVHDWMDIWRKNVSCFLFASQFMANKTEEFWGKGRVELDFLRNPFDVEKHRIDLNVGDYILYFGRLIDEKGVDVLMEAAALAPEVPVVVVGEGPDRAKLERLATSLPNVRVVGPAWGSELSVWLKHARAVVVPSLWHENFPYVILQAFAAAKPVIGSDRGGIPELIGAGPHGWTYEALDANALAGLMQKVKRLSDEEIGGMGQAAQDYVTREFTDEKIYQRLMEIYTKVLA